MSQHDQPDGDGTPANVGTDIPHPARIYDYWLGGKDNFAADREAAEWALKAVPEFRDYAFGNRKFLVRAVRYLCDAGVRQFLDIGTGFPTSPNVNEIAHSADPDSRVVYVDNDPMVFVHAEALLGKVPGTAAVHADLRDVDEVLAKAGSLLDFTQPVALLFIACLHHIEEADDPAGIVARYLAALAPESYLVLSHSTDEFAPDRMRAAAEDARERAPSSSLAARTRSCIFSTITGSSTRDSSSSPTGALTRIPARTRIAPGPTAALPRSDTIAY